MTETMEERQVRFERAEAVVRHEFEQFQHVRNEGGRADCQDNWPEFHLQRVPQFLTWPLALIDSYATDLADADVAGRNLLTEKYARMMESTEPERYAAEIAPSLPRLAPERVALQEQIIAIQVDWAAEFREAYPRLGAGMRLLRTAEDTLEDTSFETYLRGELGTYSDRTLGMYGELVASLGADGLNLTERTLAYTVVLAGFAGLDEAEAAQRDN